MVHCVHVAEMLTAAAAAGNASLSDVNKHRVHSRHRQTDRQTDRHVAVQQAVMCVSTMP